MSSKDIPIAQPFIAPFRLSSRQVMRNSDYNALRTEVRSAFPLLSEEDVSSLLPKKLKGHVDKLSCNVFVYGVDPDEPLFFRMTLPTTATRSAVPKSKSAPQGSLVPTLFALWRCPHMLPPIYVHANLLPRVTGAAPPPVFMPGVWAPALPDAFFHTSIRARKYADLFDVRAKDASQADKASDAAPEQSTPATSAPEAQPEPEADAAASPSAPAFPEGMYPASFNFFLRPSQLRALFIMGRPLPVAVGVTPATLPADPLAYAQAEAKTGEFTPPWPQPWPQTWPHAAVPGPSADVPLASLLPPAALPATELLPHSLDSITVPAPAEATITNLAASSPSYAPHSLTALANSPWHSRPVGRGPCLYIAHSLNDHLFKAAHPRCIPTSRFVFPSRDTCAPLPDADCARAWALTLSALRCAWLGCVANPAAGAEDEEGAAMDAEDAEEEEEESADELDVALEQQPANSPVPDSASASTLPTSTSTTPAPASVSEPVMTLRVAWALQFALKLLVTDDMLPLSDSDLVGRFVRLCLACPSLLRLRDHDADAEAEAGARPGPGPVVPLNLKATKFKQLSGLLKHAQKSGWLTFKVLPGGATQITSINRSHRDVAGVAHENKDLRAYQQTARRVAAGLPLVAEPGDEEPGAGACAGAAGDEDDDDAVAARVKVVTAVRTNPQLHSFVCDADPAFPAGPEPDAGVGAASLRWMWREQSWRNHRVCDLGSLVHAVTTYAKKHGCVVVQKPGAAPVVSESESEEEEEPVTRRKQPGDDGYDSFDDFEPRSAAPEPVKEKPKSKPKQKQKKLSAPQNKKLGTGNKPVAMLVADAPLRRALRLQEGQTPLASEIAALVQRATENVHAMVAPAVHALAQPLGKAPASAQAAWAQGSATGISDGRASVGALLSLLEEPGPAHAALQTMGKVKWSAGPVPTVSIACVFIKGRAITLVAGLELFGLDPERIAADGVMRQFLACALTTVDAEDRAIRQMIPVSLAASVKSLLYAQGDQHIRTAEFLTQKLGIEQACIQAYHKGKKVKQ